MVRRFRTTTDGAVALIFSLALIPMLMLAGIVIDYGANSNARQQAQNAVDAAVLALAKLPPSTTDAVLRDKAVKQVTAAMARTQAEGLSVALQRADDTIRVTLNATTPTTLTRLGASPACRSWSRAAHGAAPATWRSPSSSTTRAPCGARSSPTSRPPRRIW